VVLVKSTELEATEFAEIYQSKLVWRGSLEVIRI
jgi:hypothetical protein